MGAKSPDLSLRSLRSQHRGKGICYFYRRNAWQWAQEKARPYCQQFPDIHPIPEKSFVSFIIEKDGYVSSPEIAKSSGYPEIDEQALEIVKSMPRWQPGKYKGKPVRIRYVVPVIFSI